MREEDLHYLGGLFDGDGCFSIGARSGGHRLTPTVQMVQTCRSVEWEAPPDGEHERHYAAGLIDSDGYLTIGVAKNESCGLGFHQTPKIGISMKTEPQENPAREAVERLWEDAGVDTATDTRADGEQWMKRASGSPAISVIEELAPYLRLKQEQARLILSVDWGEVNRSREAFLEAAEVRRELKEHHGGRGSKYDYETLKELTEPEDHGNAMEADW